MTTKTRWRYTEEFKAEAVRLVRDTAQPVAQVARNLGIADICSIAGGLNSTRGGTRQSMRAEQEELARLRRENATLKQEREFLRRAAAFFAKESR